MRLSLSDRSLGSFPFATSLPAAGTVLRQGGQIGSILLEIGCVDLLWLRRDGRFPC